MAQVKVGNCLHQGVESAADNPFVFVLCQSKDEGPACFYKLSKVNCAAFLRNIVIFFNFGSIGM